MYHCEMKWDSSLYVNHYGESRYELFSMLTLLCVRGFCLWFLIPLVTLLWLLTFPLWLRRHVSLGSLLGWADINFIALIDRSILRPFVRDRMKWIPLKAAGNVVHRITIYDPM